MSGRVGAEQTPDIAAVRRLLAEFPTDATGHITDCGYDDNDGDCGCYSLPKRLRAALAPVLAAAVREARAAELREEWGHRYPDGSILADSSEAVAKSRALMAKIDGRPLELMVRHVTAWDRADRIDVDAPEGGEGR